MRITVDSTSAFNLESVEIIKEDKSIALTEDDSVPPSEALEPTRTNWKTWLESPICDDEDEDSSDDEWHPSEEVNEDEEDDDEEEEEDEETKELTKKSMNSIKKNQAKQQSFVTNLVKVIYQFLRHLTKCVLLLLVSPIVLTLGMALYELKWWPWHPTPLQLLVHLIKQLMTLSILSFMGLCLIQRTLLPSLKRDVVIDHALAFYDTILRQWEIVRTIGHPNENSRLVWRLETLTVLSQMMGMIVLTWLILNFYRRRVGWFAITATICNVLGFTSFLSPMYNVIQQTIYVAKIYAMDPNFALVGEPIVISFDERHLEQNGTIAWMPYYGCRSFQKECEKISEGSIQQGRVEAFFTMVDDYIPCYRPPLSPLKLSKDYTCYDNVVLKVKEPKSIPGWSKTSHGDDSRKAEEQEEGAINGYDEL